MVLVAGVSVVEWEVVEELVGEVVLREGGCGGLEARVEKGVGVGVGVEVDIEGSVGW